MAAWWLGRAPPAQRGAAVLFELEEPVLGDGKALAEKDADFGLGGDVGHAVVIAFNLHRSAVRCDERHVLGGHSGRRTYDQHQG